MGIALNCWLARFSAASSCQRSFRTVRRAAQWDSTRRESSSISSHPDHDERAEQCPRGKDAQPAKGVEPLNTSLHALRSQTIALRSNELELSYLRSCTARDAEISLAQQREEADVEAVGKLGTLVIDEAPCRANTRAWLEILQLRQRHDGLQGVLQVWRGMKYRQFELPMTGDDADALWTVMLRSTIRSSDSNAQHRSRLASELLIQAEQTHSRTGLLCPSIHRTLVGEWWTVCLGTATAWHDELMARGLAPRNAVKNIIDQVLPPCSNYSKHISAYLNLQRGSEDHHLYDFFMDKAVARLRPVSALAWHQAFIKRGEPPTKNAYWRPDIQMLVKMNLRQSLPMGFTQGTHCQLSDLQICSDKFPVLALSSDWIDQMQDHREEPESSRGATASSEERSGAEQKKAVGQSVVARLLATHVIPLETVLRTISILGIEHMDAVSLRELVLRCESHEEFLERMAALRRQGVNKSPQGTYERLLCSFAEQGESQMFRVLVESDHHPDNYGDVHLQADLLEHCLLNGQAIEARVAQEALLQTPGRGPRFAWNINMKNALRTRQWALVEQSLAELQAGSFHLHKSTLGVLNELLLTDCSQDVWEQDGTAYDRLAFVANAYLYQDKIKGDIHPSDWKELLKLHARVGDWAAIQKIALYLAARYEQCRRVEQLDPRDESTPFVQVEAYTKPRNAERPQRGCWRQSSVYAAVLSKVTLQALFIWGFRMGSDIGSSSTSDVERESDEDDWACEEAQQPEDWARGLVLLRQIKDRGVPVALERVRSAFIDQMKILFGPGKSRHEANQEMRHKNQLDLAHYVEYANQLWDGNMFPNIDATMLDTSSPGQQFRLALYIFGEGRRARPDRDDTIDVKAWLGEVLAAERTRTERSAQQQQCVHPDDTS